MTARLTLPGLYARLEDALEPSWPLMVALAAIVIGLTLALVLWGHPAPLAAWLAWALLP